MTGKGVQINRTEPDSKKANISEMLKIPNSTSTWLIIFSRQKRYFSLDCKGKRNQMSDMGETEEKMKISHFS